MKTEKFENDTRIVHKFIQLYCDKNHTEAAKDRRELLLSYHDANLGKIEYNLCETCEQTLLYSHQRLLKCPHDEKPKCRKCQNPCYEKTQWKTLAKIMRYSGMQMGLLRVKKMFGK